jgi:hypothetical protein
MSVAPLPGSGSPLPGHYWRELLAEAVEVRGSRWSVEELLHAVARCDAGLVDVVGWLTDELRTGRVQPIDGGDYPASYEMAPGAPSYRHQLRR